MGNAKKNERVRQMARRTIRVLELNKDKPNVLLVKMGSALANYDKIEELAKAMHHAGVSGIVCVVDDFDNLATLSVEEMNQQGWYFAPDEKDESI